MLYALDIETTGLNAWKDGIFCIGIWNTQTHEVFRSLDKFKQFLLDTPNAQFVTHNGAFDFKFLVNKGAMSLTQVGERWKCDTKILGHVHREKVPDSFIEEYETARKALPNGSKHREGSKLSLKTMAPYFLGVKPFWEEPENHDNDEYVLKDCEYTWLLWKQLYDSASETELRFYQNRMMPWQIMLLKAELTGITIDIELLSQLKSETATIVSQLEKELRTVFGEAQQAYQEKQVKEIEEEYSEMREAAVKRLKNPTPEKESKTRARYLALETAAIEKVELLNFDSPKQMLWLLKDFYKFNVETYKGEDSTGKAILERLSNEGHEPIKKLLEYRDKQKLYSSFLEPYGEKAIDGVIHPSFNLCGTRTGRLSSSDPNLQQVPGEIYKLFRAREGKTFVQYDMGMIEAILIAYYSDDAELTELVQKGLSIHDANALSIFDLPCTAQEVKKRYTKERDAAKRLGFACFYGAGWRRIQQALQEAGYRFTDKQCRLILDGLKARFSGAFSFHAEITERLLGGEEVINLLGRPIYIENPEDVYMKGFNKLIQSSASDLVCQSAWKSQQDVLLLVHDFILTEVPVKEALQKEADLVTAMTNYNLTNSFGKLKLIAEGCTNERWTK